MGFLCRCGVFAIALSTAGCAAPLDVESALRVSQVSSGWFDAGLDNLGRNKFVPTVSFRLENSSENETGSMQLLGKFLRQDEEEEWGSKFIRVAGTEGIEAGQLTDLMP